MRYSCLLLLLLALPVQAQWRDLLANGLDEWEVVGDGVWTLMKDGTLVGQRNRDESSHQSWLYTRKEFGEYDLQFNYWTPLGVNSGISIRDKTRARWAHGEHWDRDKTPPTTATRSRSAIARANATPPAASICSPTPREEWSTITTGTGWRSSPGTT